MVDLPNDSEPSAEDFDQNGALTREFLLRRGFCCDNGCRNCPYGFVLLDEATPGMRFREAKRER